MESKETTINSMVNSVKRVREFNPELALDFIRLSTVLSFVPENKYELSVRKERTDEQAAKVSNLLGNINQMIKLYLQYEAYMNEKCSAINSPTEERKKELSEFTSKYRDYLHSQLRRTMKALLDLS